jgi:hypothetical protein
MIEGSDGNEQLFSVEILDICGLSAEYCKKCEADETGAAIQAPISRASAEETPAPREQAARNLVPDAEPERDRHRIATFLDAHHPKFMYHLVKPPVRVYCQKEIDELGPEWSETYIHQEYPKAKYHWTGKTVTVKSLDEEVALGGGWADSPSAFDPYIGPRPARTNQQDPTKWVDDWPVSGLSAEHRTKIKAQLLRADAAFWASPESTVADLTSMKLAFDGIAKVLFEAGILTERLLQDEIPALVWDSAMAGGW